MTHKEFKAAKGGDDIDEQVITVQDDDALDTAAAAILASLPGAYAPPAIAAAAASSSPSVSSGAAAASNLVSAHEATKAFRSRGGTCVSCAGSQLNGQVLVCCNPGCGASLCHDCFCAEVRLFVWCSPRDWLTNSLIADFCVRGFQCRAGMGARRQQPLVAMLAVRAAAIKPGRV